VRFGAGLGAPTKTAYMKNYQEAFTDKLSEELKTEAFVKKAREIFRVNPPIDPKSFEGVPGYATEEIAKDTAWVQEMEQRFDAEGTPEQKELKKYATILEAMLNEMIGLHNLLGQRAEAITSSDFDDIRNGVDLIVEFQDETGENASHLALAIDVTFTSAVNEKIRRIKDKIIQGELTSIKYFSSEFLGSKGKLLDVPRVVIGIDRSSIEELGEVWLSNNKRALATHGVQRVVLDEVVMELEGLAEFARMHKKERVARAYEFALETVRGVLEKKADIPAGTMENDRVFGAIRREMEGLRRQVAMKKAA